MPVKAKDAALDEHVGDARQIFDTVFGGFTHEVSGSA